MLKFEIKFLMKGKRLSHNKLISKDHHDQNKNSAANYIECLCDVSWYTADP
jgi:hypothetical protein